MEELLIYTLKYDVFGRFSSIVANKLAKTNKHVRAPINLQKYFRYIYFVVQPEQHLNEMDIVLVYNANNNNLVDRRIQ